MVLQYPDTITIPQKATEGTKVNGIWTQGTQPSEITQKGRYEPTTLNKETFIVDGNELKVKGVFYCPLNTEDVDIGIIISISNKLNEVIVVKSKVLFFSRGQMNCRIFI